MLLEIVSKSVASNDTALTGQLLRLSNSADEDEFVVNRQKANGEFFDWQVRVSDWDLELQLIDLEWTLDGQSLILYVLNGQNAETTRLALLAAAAGLGIVHVQPVEADGIVHQPSGGGCGSGGGGCGSGGGGMRQLKSVVQFARRRYTRGARRHTWSPEKFPGTPKSTSERGDVFTFEYPVAPRCHPRGPG